MSHIQSIGHVMQLHSTKEVIHSLYEGKGVVLNVWFKENTFMYLVLCI